MELCSSEKYTLSCFDRSFVHKLTMVKCMSFNDFNGFDTLQELHLTFEKVAVVDLSVCPSVRIFNTKSDLGAIILTACCDLEEFECSGHTNLTAIDLSSCISLTSFTCVQRRLNSLDISCCLSL